MSKISEDEIEAIVALEVGDLLVAPSGVTLEIIEVDHRHDWKGRYVRSEFVTRSSLDGFESDLREYHIRNALASGYEVKKHE